MGIQWLGYMGEKTKDKSRVQDAFFSRLLHGAGRQTKFLQLRIILEKQRRKCFLHE
ncbi:hypothetical protein ACLOJK_024371 [Asimina triloba]